MSIRYYMMPNMDGMLLTTAEMGLLYADAVVGWENMMVGLYYQPENGNPPIVCGKGNRPSKSILLQEIRRKGIYYTENPPLARLLFHTVKIGDEIPMHLYEASAIVLVEAFRWYTKKPSFIAFDIETTGVSLVHDRIIEIGAVRVDNGCATGYFHKIVNPERGISQSVQDITGISSQMALKAPSINEVLPDFRKFCGDKDMVAHNMEIDASFLIKEGKQCGVRFPNHFIDTLAMAREKIPYLQSYFIQDVANEMGTFYDANGTAAEYAQTVGEVYMKLAMDNGVNSRYQNH